MSANPYLQFLREQDGLFSPADLDDPFALYGSEKQIFRPTSFTERTTEYLIDADIPWLREAILAASGAFEDFGNKSLMVYGDPGMGKSAIMKSIAKDICNLYNRRDGTSRKFVTFEDVAGNEETIKQVLKSPKDYYVFITISLTTIQPFEMKGIPGISEDPDVKESRMVKVLLDPWMALLNTPDLAGMLFLDELNQAEAPTQTTIYGLIHNATRMVNAHTKIMNSSRWSVHGAGNLPEDERGVTELLQALKERFAQVWLRITYSSWKEWAVSDEAEKTAKNYKGELESRRIIHPLIIKFLDDSHELYSDDKFRRIFDKPSEEVSSSKGNSPSPRAFELISDSIYSIVARNNMRFEQMQAAYNDPNADDNIKADLEREYKKLLSSFIDSVYRAAATHVNISWCNKFKSSLKVNKRAIAMLFDDPDIVEFDKKVLSNFTFGKHGTDIKGVTSAELTANVGIARDKITKLVETILFESGYVVMQNGRAKLVTSPNLEALKKDASTKDRIYKSIYAIFKVVGVLKKPANDIAAILASYYQDYSMGGKLPAGIAAKIVGDLMNKSSGLYTPQQVKALFEVARAQTPVFFTKQQIQAAKEHIKDKLDEESEASYDASEDEEGIASDQSANQGGTTELEEDNEWLEAVVDFLDDFV